jgi:hypothetical protein
MQNDSGYFIRHKNVPAVIVGSNVDPYSTKFLAPLKYNEYTNVPISYVRVNGDPDSHALVYYGAMCLTDKTVTHSGGGFSWKITQSSAARAASSQAFTPLRVATAVVDSTSRVRVTAWVRRTSDDFTARLVCRANQLPGLPRSEVVAAGAIDVWEQLTLDVLPASTGVIEFYIEAYGSALNQWVYVDDVEVADAP